MVLHAVITNQGISITSQLELELVPSISEHCSDNHCLPRGLISVRPFCVAAATCDALQHCVLKSSVASDVHVSSRIYPGHHSRSGRLALSISDQAT